MKFPKKSLERRKKKNSFQRKEKTTESTPQRAKGRFLEESPPLKKACWGNDKTTSRLSLIRQQKSGSQLVRSIIMLVLKRFKYLIKLNLH